MHSPVARAQAVASAGHEQSDRTEVHFTSVADEEPQMLYLLEQPLVVKKAMRGHWLHCRPVGVANPDGEESQGH